MKTHLTLLLLAFTACASSNAQIGETLEQCRQRYGEPTKQAAPGEIVFFQGSGLVIAVNFHDGKADSVAFRKPKPDAQGQFDEFTDAELEAFMRTQGGGRTWVQGRAVPPNRRWFTTDSELVAHYSTAERLFAIGTKSYVERKQSGKKP